uniref:Rad60/SUMO-like domain-containing protein n=1 Tax=Culex tarsalis TaxID=7177 RepID=A0A1Q3F0A6_CULTA
MSNFDVFDNLNSYLDKTDDYDVSDDADLGASFDEAEMQAPVATAKAKRGAKKAETTKLISPKKKRDKPTSQTSLHSAKSQKAEEEEEEEMESTDDEEDDLGSGSQSSIASRKTRAAAAVVEIADDGMEQQISAIKRQYDIIFNQNKTFTDSNKKFFSGLKRRYNTLAKQFHNKSRNKTFPEKLQELRDEMYDICVNSNLFAPPEVPVVPAAPAPVVNSQLPAKRTGTRRSLRGRRQEPELINLVDSPALVLPGVVNLDSDEDEDCVMAVKEADESFDSENYELSLKIKWEGKLERFTHRKHQKFADLIGQLAKRAGSDPSYVVLDINERIINPEDTPDSINYRISQFISGRVMQGKLADMFVGGRPNGTKPAVNKNLIKLKVQSDRWKQPLEVQIEKDRKMKLVVIKCAEQLKCAPGEIKLSFDGDPVELDSTPLELDLEGGEILDLRFVK